MAITIKRNDNGSCIIFEGSSQPAYWYACLTAEIDGEDANRINVINQISSTDGAIEYEFYKMLFTEFLDEDGTAFADAPACIAYINDRTNPSVETGGTSFAQTEHMDFERDATNTSIMFSNGDTHGVNSVYASAESDGTISIKTTKSDVVLYSGLNHDNLTLSLADAGGSINDVVNALNAYFSVSPVASGGDYVPSYETLPGVAVAGNDAEGQTPTTGTPTHILTTATDTSSGHGARYWSDETIDAAGEYFTVKLTGRGRFILALSDADDATMQAALLNDSGNGHSGITWGNAVYDYGSYKEPWTTYGTGGLSYGPGWIGATTTMMRYNTTVQDAFDNMDEVLFKIGINNEGYIAVWYWDEGRTNDWIMTARRGTTTPAGNYRLVVKLWDQNSTLVETPLRVAIDPVAPVMTYHYVESPDSVFNYPLFATIEEAEYYDTENGGAGAYTQQIFIDDTTPGRIWYAPVTGYTSTASAAPADTSEITWNVVTTQADNLFAPAAFSFSDITADELSAITLQIIPADASFTTAVAFVPATPGLGIVGANIEGTLPEVSGDNVSNPSDTIVATVTRTNNFGSASASFNIVVANLTAPATAMSGFTWENTSTVLVDSDTMDDGSVVHFDDTIASNWRFMVPQAYVEANILPALQAAGDVVYLGIDDGTAVWSSIEDADWQMFIKWEWVSASSHRSTLQNGSTDAVVINSLTDALYDYAIEVEGTSIGIIACNVNSIMNEPSIGNGGTFSRSLLTTGYAGTIPAQVSFASVSTQTDFTTTNISEFIIPAPSNWIQVTETGAHVINFDGSTAMPTLNAGYTYRFLVGDVVYADQTTSTSLHSDETLRFTTDGVSEYTTGITRSGTVGTAGAYIEFAVPADVPPLYWYTDHFGIGTGNAATISGSTYVVAITGITLEGPAANQTGTNITDNGDYGWMSIDEQLGHGERFVMDNAFFTDLFDEMPNAYEIRIGLKGTSWDNGDQSTKTNSAVTGEVFRGDLQLRISGSTQSKTFQLFKPGTNYNTMLVNTPALQDTTCAFIELDSSGDNIRMGFGRNGNLSITQGDEATVAYSDWNAYRGETGDQGYGITSIDVMVLVTDVANFSDDFDGDNVDWTLLSEVSTPTAAASLTTSWAKAIDFSGSSERMLQVANISNYNPIRMGDGSSTVAAPTAGRTSNATSSRPWHAAVVFSSDNHNSNQHIWNQGDGSGSNDDNIYMRLSSTRELYFGWGRDGALNECYLGTLASGSGNWYGFYVAHTGERLSGNNASAANLADCFEIYSVNLQTGVVGINLSSVFNWTNTGGRMDRTVGGNFTVGGRGSNRSFHGKVASMVVSTLRRNQVMPTTAEVSMMVRDPMQWLTDYKIGVSYRRPTNSYNDSGFQLNSSFSNQATQVWLMGDGANDAYAQIRNQVFPTLGNQTPLNMISMVSNDIETVNISGLT